MLRIAPFSCLLGGWLLFLSGIASAGTQTKDIVAKAEAGDPEAQYDLSIAYYDGAGVPKDLAKSFEWCRKAANQGLAVAQNNLGSMYQSGDGVTQSDSDAFVWYQKAAEQGFHEAWTSLGYLYDMGRGVAQDRTKAVELYKRGADLGSLNGMLNLGISYMDGAGVEVNLVEAYKWLDLVRFYTQRSSNMQLKWTARGLLDEVSAKMSKPQIKEAKRLAKQWDESHAGK